MNYELTDEQLANLGKVIVRSAELETTLDWMIPKVGKLSPELYNQLVGGKMVGAKIALLRTVGAPRLRGKKKSEHFKNIMICLERFITERNIVVHGTWSPGGKGNTVNALVASMVGLASLGIGLSIRRPIAAASKKHKDTVAASRLEGLAQDFDIVEDGLRWFYNYAWGTPAAQAKARRQAAKRARAAAASGP